MASMNGFDKFCAVLAFVLGVALLVLGVLGLFLGCNAHFTLPPVAGIIPAFVAWGILKPIIVAWNRRPERPLPPEPLPGSDYSSDEV